MKQVAVLLLVVTIAMTGCKSAAKREKEKQAETRASASAQNAQLEADSAKVKNSASKKLTFKEKRELETLESDIAAAEKRQAVIVKELNLFATDSYKVNQLYTEQQQAAKKLEKDLERWAELADKDA